MKGILRTEWDFKGFTVTDMVNPAPYMNPRDSLIVGTDGMLTASSANNIKNNVSGWGEFTVEGLAEDMDMQQAIQDAVHHALYVFINSNVTNGYSQNARSVTYRTWYDNAITALIVVTATLTALSATGYVVATVLEKKNEEEVA